MEGTIHLSLMVTIHSAMSMTSRNMISGTNSLARPSPLMWARLIPGAPWTGGHILNLPQSIQIKDGSGTIRSRTDFAYDEATPQGLSPFPVHNDGNLTAPRGNLTSVTRYPDLSDLTKKITRTFTFDAAGNEIISPT